MDRAQLFDALSHLAPQDFERLLVAVNMPRMNRAGASAKIGEQVNALLEWADSSIGPGVEAIARHLADLNRFEFDAYRRSLVATYEKWWEHYTLTDAIGKVQPPTPDKSSAFDFGLMVQTVTKEREPTEPENNPPQPNKEKTERLPVLEGIRKYANDHVLLVGRPGSGKSTALIRLLLEEAALSPGPSPKVGRGGQERIPVLVELRYWQSSVLERIRAFLYQHDPHLNLDDATLTALLRQGRFLLLIDGLNELPSDEARTQLTTFRRDHPKVPMIFTTRDLGLGGDLGIEKKLEMQSLTEAQMKAFIRAYVPDQAEAMLRQLSDRLWEFGQTPLLLWMLCEVFQQSPHRQMPTNLAEVFRAFTTMYEDSSVRKHEVALLKGDVRALSDRRLWKEALKALAALMMQGETPVDFRVAIHRTEAEHELGRIFAKERFPARDILDDLLKYHLLQNRTTDQLEFRHQLIQEYYAAEYLLPLLPKLSDERLKRDYLNLLKWTEPIALMLALANEEAQALRVVNLAMDDVDLILGARLAGEVKPKFQTTAVNWIETLHMPPVLKCQCSASSRSEIAVPMLLKVFEQGDYPLKVRVLEVLGVIGSDAVIPHLLAALDHPGPMVYQSAARVLSQIGSPTAISSLILYAKNSENAWRIFRVLESEAAIPVLKIGLKSRSEYVRKDVIEALKKIGGEASIQLLIQALEDTPLIVRDAIQALGQLGSQKAVPALITIVQEPKTGRETAAPALINDIQACAIKALGQIGSKEAVPELLAILQGNSSNRRLIPQALGKIGGEIATPGLINCLEDSDVRVSRSAAKILEELDSKPTTSTKKIHKTAALTSLLVAAESTNHEMFDSAIQVLKSQGYNVALLEMIDLIKSQGWNREKTNSVLKFLGDTANESTISSLLTMSRPKQPWGEPWDKASRAIRALGEIGRNDLLIRLLESSYNKNIYSTLTATGDSSLLSSLSRLRIKNPNDDLERTIQAIQSRCKFYNHEIFHDIIPVDKTISIYCSYASADEALQTQLANHLTLLERQGIITSWSSNQILPGDGRTKTIHQQLNAADIILLLISPDAIADDACYHHLEIYRAMKSGRYLVIPILLRPVDWQDWEGASFGQLDVLPKNHQPVTTWQNQDQAFQEIAEGIRSVAMEMRREKDNSGKMDAL